MEIFNQDTMFVFIAMVLNLKGMSYRELASVCDIPEYTINKLKTGRQRLTTEKVEVLFEGLEVDSYDYIQFVKYLNDSGANTLMTIRD